MRWGSGAFSVRSASLAVSTAGGPLDRSSSEAMFEWVVEFGCDEALFRAREMASSALVVAVEDNDRDVRVDVDVLVEVAVTGVRRGYGLGVRRQEAQTKDWNAFILAGYF